MLILRLKQHVQRKSHSMLAQYGVRLEFSAAIDKATMSRPSDTLAYNHAMNQVLHMNSLAEPGAIIVGASAHTELGDCFVMERVDFTNSAPCTQGVYRLVNAPKFLV